MKSKSVLYALAVIVLTGGMAVAAFAEAPVASLSADPEQGLSPWGAGEIREPVETGAVPDRVEGSSDLFKQATGEEPAVEIGGQMYRPGVDTGP
ncbi:MAG TPA: hypothetical protein VK429_04865 [Patescibacteria group bacterium]|nr:hypothetical protein [Patescibacteria group bacterium]